MRAIGLSVFAAALLLSVLAFAGIDAGNSSRYQNEGYGRSTPYLTHVIFDYDSVIPLDIIEETRNSGGSITVGSRVRNLTFIVDAARGYNFSFFLDGFDHQASFHTNDFIKDYTNLPPGNYTLMIQYTSPTGTTGSDELIRVRVLQPWYLTWPALMSYPAFIIVFLWFVYEQLNLRFARRRYMLEQIINTRTEELITEKEKSESLLANVLPKSTADEIMLKGKATKTKYNFATVLFSDIEGFTKIAEEMNPEILIDELDKFFFHFDSVVEKLNIEKIKTIGDAYMCAGGIPERNRTNPVEVVLAAVQMQNYMADLKREAEKAGRYFFDIRIGIHTGTVIAGVVGYKKLSYDIWGDTVNTASRMESSGEAGKINISGTTYEFVKEFFDCVYRGKMPVKYKGDIDMYFVRGFRSEMTDDGVSPNRRFMLKLKSMKLLDVEEYVIKLFDDEAPPGFFFHNSQFVRSLSTQVEILSRAEQIREEDYIVTRLAALLLYTGLLEEYNNPSEYSAIKAEKVLSRIGFGYETVDAAKEVIHKFYDDDFDSDAMAVLHDSVFDYLGRIDYADMAERLRKEMREAGYIYSDKEWIEMQGVFLAKHDFLTSTARMLRSYSIERQIDQLKELCCPEGDPALEEGGPGVSGVAEDDSGIREGDSGAVEGDNDVRKGDSGIVKGDDSGAQ